MPRLDITFVSCNGACAAWLYRPQAQGPAPVLVAHGFSAVRDRVRALAGRSPPYIPAVGPSGTLAVMSTPDAQPGFAQITPAATTLTHAARVPRAEIRRYASGRFGIDAGQLFERAVADQTEFLTRTLGVRS